MSTSSPKSTPSSPPSLPSLICALSGSSPYAFTNEVMHVSYSAVGIKCVDAQFRASSEVYFTMTSALSSWKSRRDRRTISPWLIHTYVHITLRPGVIKNRRGGGVPSFASFLWYVLISSRHQSIGPPNGRYPASSSPVRTLVHPLWRPVHACHRRSRSFHVSDFFLPTVKEVNGGVVTQNIHCGTFPLF
jgi:hypothetical protein